ncbi:Hypothetical predicted protein [Olea europaea subsp. europaea]|uniref:Transmembrane protein n=1 Tax=Olea europaea subsp. europaea TaxID=158383 RepID=A0A8S0R018_OLEEU|nr:Hypothetical predicted protein [Olea europaea subsp. europaea]
MVAVLADESSLLESEADGNIGMVCVVAPQISMVMVWMFATVMAWCWQCAPVAFLHGAAALVGCCRWLLVVVAIVVVVESWNKMLVVTVDNGDSDGDCGGAGGGVVILGTVTRRG